MYSSRILPTATDSDSEWKTSSKFSGKRKQITQMNPPSNNATSFKYCVAHFVLFCWQFSDIFEFKHSIASLAMNLSLIWPEDWSKDSSASVFLKNSSPIPSSSIHLGSLSQIFLEYCSTASWNLRTALGQKSSLEAAGSHLVAAPSPGSVPSLPLEYRLLLGEVWCH